MGQYYKIVNLDKDEEIHPHEHGDGLKLMEHSWIGNTTVNQVLSALHGTGPWYKSRLVWIGDYSTSKYTDYIKDKKAIPTAKLLDELDNTRENLYSMSRPRCKKLPEVHSIQFACNHTKKEYVKLSTQNNTEDWIVNPLPLLLADGNGLGGGDYNGPDPKALVGSWSGDVISAEDNVPTGKWKLIEPDFEEDSMGWK